MMLTVLRVVAAAAAAAAAAAPEFVYHAGPGKTGTTAIQQAASRHRAALARDGVERVVGAESRNA